MSRKDTEECWCGSRQLEDFSPEYRRCIDCETLVYTHIPPRVSEVIDDDTAFYGRQYWFSHQEADLHLPNLEVRARRDLPERCLFWLQHLLEHKLPPGRVLEIGCGHGGFLRLLRLAGFDARGLELSPWVVRFAHTSFDVPVFIGRLENQVAQPESFDVIILMDVLEHLPEPAVTLRHCLTQLKPDGILILQTPAYPEGATLDELQKGQAPFLKMLLPLEHLYLFSRRALSNLLDQLGLTQIHFKRPLFPEHDMLVFAGRESLGQNSQSDVEDALAGTPNGRIIQALFDKNEHFQELQRTYAEVQRALLQERESIHRITSALAEHSEAARQRLAAVHELTNMLRAKENFIGDLQRAAEDRLGALHELTRTIKTRDARILELDTAARERLIAIHELTSGIKARDTLIASLERAAHQRLQSLESTKTPAPRAAPDNPTSAAEQSAAPRKAVSTTAPQQAATRSSDVEIL
jgi:2-polyprenyl-3-methyl-5-hydroxy-6-metoxy-1,4-benzoquinol methylase